MRRSINVLCLSATALVLLPAGAMAQQKTLKEQIQGPWSLASCNSTTPKGEKAPYCVSNPRGILILAGNGNYAWTVIAGGRKDVNAPGVADNFGTWSVNEADKTLAFHIVEGINPATEGRDVKLNISLNGEGELKIAGDLSIPGGPAGHFDVSYRRFK
jgi:hypothetical protein